MFNPSRDEARRFLIESWAKFRAGEPMSGLEKIRVGMTTVEEVLRETVL